MFNNKKGSDYSQVNLDDFSDDSSNGDDDFVSGSIRNQQVSQSLDNIAIWIILTDMLIDRS